MKEKEVFSQAKAKENRYTRRKEKRNSQRLKERARKHLPQHSPRFTNGTLPRDIKNQSIKLPYLKFILPFGSDYPIHLTN